MTATRGAARLDARDKATGATRYVADLSLPGQLHVAVVRSPLPHAEIEAVDVSSALAAPGVVGVFTADDIGAPLFGRRVRDAPVLAVGKVRYVGEPVAAVVADTRRHAERAATLVDVAYRELPVVASAAEATAPEAPMVHDAPWDYPGAVVGPGDGPNLQSVVRRGDEDLTAEALRSAPVVVDALYTTPAGHQGYLEPQGCVARVGSDGLVEVWINNKSPYRLVGQLAASLGLEPDRIVVHPVPIGGDFGGKGSPMAAPLCVALSRLTGRPCRLVLRYSEDLTSTNPRHPTTMRVRLGADRDGHLLALRFDSLADGGAYAAFKPIASVNLHGVLEAGSPYRIPHRYIESRIAYTTTVPKGHARAPGAPQATFAVESAMDELAGRLGIDPVELRRRNVLGDGDPNPDGVVWIEARGREVLDAAVAALTPRPVPLGWQHGWGISLYDRATAPGQTSLRLLDDPDGGGVVAEVPIPETGTGNHTVVREGLARLLGLGRDRVRVVHVPTSDLPGDAGVGGSRVTASLSEAVERAAAAWAARTGSEPVVVSLGEAGGAERVTSFSAQIAQVAVDPETGQVRVLEIVSAVDVADIVNPAAHRMQIDGGAAMGFGFALLEDLKIEGGQVGAGNLGDFRMPTAHDLPALTTVLVTGGRGVGALNVKQIGELTNVPTAAAIANAVAAATGARIRSIPLTAEAVLSAMGAPE
ncbi:MAG TPA: xanthine dehydrogenase family protein molybdopterin-binding subunit [Acidimicrobiales bacterium]|nr:xanthine dehydrogenase family protein molybdopterin-binding subunit [Acidimicrobiales bacterium]